MCVTFQLIILMFNLFVSHYRDSSPVRQKELDQALINNLNCEKIDKVYLFLEGDCNLKALPNNQKIIPINLRARPYYDTIFMVMRDVSGPDDVNILLNSDIYVDETIAHADKYDHNVALCLTRYDVHPDRITFFNRADSQDCWIIKGKPKMITADFYMGIPGCDNALAARLHKVGYHVINPSLTIKTYHLHRSGKRNYSPNDKVPMPYKFLNACI